MVTMLTDTHCHLDLPIYGSDRMQVLGRAAEAGVSRILIPGIKISSCLQVIHLAQTDPILYAAVGVHPTEAGTWDPASKVDLLALAKSCKKVAAIGEIGLDFYWNTCPHDTQQQVLEDQLHLAEEINLPVIIHCREKGDALDGPCSEVLFQILSSWTQRLNINKLPLGENPGVLHSYSGSLAYAKKFLDLGFYLGITGPVTYRKDRQELIAALPLERLLLETDSPYLTPVPWRGKRNEPGYVTQIADKIAECKGSSTEQVAKMTYANAKRLFGWG